MKISNVKGNFNQTYLRSTSRGLKGTHFVYKHYIQIRDKNTSTQYNLNNLVPLKTESYDFHCSFRKYIFPLFSILFFLIHFFFKSLGI